MGKKNAQQRKKGDFSKRGIRVSMQSDEKALTNGLLFGSDEGFSPQLKELTREAGVSHLVAASGANLRFVESLWSLVFWPFGTHFVQSTSIAAILGYWFLAEQSGSLWRASLMWAITWGGRLRGQRIPAWYSLAVVVVLTIFVAPTFLTPGFWLSVLAIIGLFFSRIILSGEKKKALFPQRHFCSNPVALSLAEGSIIFVMVTLWLWTQYEVFQPIGILSTWALSFLVDPLVWFGVGESFLSQLSSRPQELPTFLNSWQTGIFWIFWTCLELFARLAQVVPIWLLTLCASVLISLSVRSWWLRRWRAERWKGIGE